MQRLVPAILLIAVAVLPAWADEEQAPELTIGDKAPSIDVAHWIKGVELDERGRFEPLETWAPGKVYVLEFWATWCGPCVASMPHLSDLQAKHGDNVTIIGVSDEPLPKVVAFLFKKYRDGKIQNDRTHYTLATDPDGSVKKEIFRAAGCRGIPTSFIVGRDGHIEWFGHPMRMDGPLEKVLAGTWDREAAKQRKVLDAQLQKAYSAEEWATAATVLDEILALEPESVSLQRLKFALLLTKLGKSEEAYALATKLVEASWDDARLLNEVAWTIVDDKGVKRRDLDLAMKIAVRAVELTEEEDAAILDTLARVHYEKGDRAKAIEIQKKAVDKCKRPRLRAQLEAVLEKYEREADGAEGG